MTETVEFVPASVRTNSLIVSSFGSGRAEFTAMAITAYLASLGAVWHDEFAYADFVNWIREEQNHAKLHEIYVSMWEMFARGLANAETFLGGGLHWLSDNGFLVHTATDGVGTFHVTDSFVDMISRFAARV